MSAKKFDFLSWQILDYLYIELNDEKMVEEWYLRIITIQTLKYKNLISNSFSSDKKQNLQLCELENELFPQLFLNNIDELKNAYPSKLFSSTIIDDLHTFFDSDFKIEKLGMLQEDLRSFERVHKFTSTNRNSDIQVDKENIRAVTQIFTPPMVSKYMVDSTIYQDESMHTFNKSIKRKAINEQFAILDPCLGTGNILLVAFDKLVKYYEEQTICSKEEIIIRISHHLYGFDIDPAAILLAKFIFHLKAYDYYSDYFTIIDKVNWQFYLIKDIDLEKKPKEKEMDALAKTFVDASFKGSLIKVNHLDFIKIEKQINQYPELFSYYQMALLLNKKYDVVLTNPPYMGRKVLPQALSSYLNENYQYGKNELYVAFMEQCKSFLKPDGLLSMITLHTWMFIKSFKELREEFISHYQIHSLLHLGKNTFENLNAYNALACAFVIENHLPYQKTCYVKLDQFDTLEQKEKALDDEKNYYYLDNRIFLKIADTPFVYWMKQKDFALLHTAPKLGSICEIRQGLATGCNQDFIRWWYEVPKDEIGFYYPNVESFLASKKKYAPYNKGGGQTKWYMTSKLVIRFDEEAYQKLKHQGNHLPSKSFYFQQGITWSLFGFNSFNVFYKEQGYVFDVSGSSLFTDENHLYYILGFLSSNVAYYYLSILAPTVNYQVGNIASLPILIDEARKEEVDKLVKNLIQKAKILDQEDETSWNFQGPVLLKMDRIIPFEKRLDAYMKNRRKLFDAIEKGEKQLNILFDEIYHIEKNNLKNNVNQEKSVKTIIQEILSYFIGVIFHRYFIEEYESRIDTTKWIEIDVVEEKIKELCTFYNIKEEEIEKGLNQTIHHYITYSFYKYHLKKYQSLPIYWYKTIDNKTYIAYYHQIKEDVTIYYDQGIKKNVALNHIKV